MARPRRESLVDGCTVADTEGLASQSEVLLKEGPDVRDPASDSDPELDEEDRRLHAVWFFLPLPHPLPVPHAGVQTGRH